MAWPVSDDDCLLCVEEKQTELDGFTHCFKKQILKFTVLMHPLEMNKCLHPSLILLIASGRLCLWIEFC